MDDTEQAAEHADARQRAVSVVVRDLERHAAADGWDRPPRLFALVRTAAALQRDPSLTRVLPAEAVSLATLDPEHLTAVEQENLPKAQTLSELLGVIGWPDTVDGAAIVLERSVVPTEVESSLPQDDLRAAQALAEHPQRQDLRMAAAVLRDGTGACAVRSRANDEDELVSVGPELIPALLAILVATLQG